jgi:hypothetical protein
VLPCTLCYAVHPKPGAHCTKILVGRKYYLKNNLKIALIRAFNKLPVYFLFCQFKY